MTRFLPLVATLSLSVLISSQESNKSQTEKAAESQTPAQIELLDTSVRFESNGDSRKEVHCVVKINSELGVRQFARLNFDYNRAFQQIEIPFVRVTHSSGGTADILPSVITDNPNPAVVNYPAYHDVRVKSVRILGLAPSDTLEYRVITTTTHHPLAPDFWLDHTFDRSGIVSHEIFTLDLPEARLRIRVNPETPATGTEKSGEGESTRVLYRWNLDHSAERAGESPRHNSPDVVLTTFASWARVSERIAHISWPGFSTELRYQAMDLVGTKVEILPPSTLYKFVSQKIATVDLPIDLSGYRRRDVGEILKSGYGTALEKAHLLIALLSFSSRQYKLTRLGLLTYTREPSQEAELPRPTPFSGALVALYKDSSLSLLDVSIDVAPFGLIPADLRGRKALNVISGCKSDSDCFVEIPRELPFAATQSVAIDATLTDTGELKARVKYKMRGDNELLLRLAFHQSPREKWSEVAQLLSLSDGFRGKVEKVSASDPYATKDPFTVEYETSQPKFVDWSKKPVRIPAVLPLVGLPDPPADPKSPIELGTPLDVQTTVTLHLPPGTTVESPAGTIVERDYATFSSQYSTNGNAINASRHIHFISRELPASRSADYNAFVRAIQNDQAQLFRVTRPEDTPTARTPGTSKP